MRGILLKRDGRCKKMMNAIGILKANVQHYRPKNKINDNITSLEMWCVCVFVCAEWCTLYTLFNDKRLLLWFDSIIIVHCTPWMINLHVQTRRMEQSMKQIALNIKLALGDSSKLLLQNNSEWLPCLRCVHSHKMLKAWTLNILLPLLLLLFIFYL